MFLDLVPAGSSAHGVPRREVRKRYHRVAVPLHGASAALENDVAAGFALDVRDVPLLAVLDAVLIGLLLRRGGR